MCFPSYSYTWHLTNVHSLRVWTLFTSSQQIPSGHVSALFLVWRSQPFTWWDRVGAQSILSRHSKQVSQRIKKVISDHAKRNDNGTVKEWRVGKIFTPVRVVRESLFEGVPFDPSPEGASLGKVWGREFQANAEALRPEGAWSFWERVDRTVWLERSE